MTQKALRFALEALDNLMYWDNGKPEYDEARDAITAIKEALANVATNDTSKESVDEMQKQRHEQEPVGYVIVKNHGKVNILDFDFDFDVAEQLSEGKYPAYITPPQRTWQGLTDKAITQVIDSMPKNMKGFMVDWDLYEFAQTIEAKLKQKNGYAEENT